MELKEILTQPGNQPPGTAQGELLKTMWQRGQSLKNEKQAYKELFSQQYNLDVKEVLKWDNFILVTTDTMEVVFIVS